MKTLDEIKEALLHEYDPEELVEILNITSEELLDRFEDSLILTIQHLTSLIEDKETRIYDYEDDD